MDRTHLESLALLEDDAVAFESRYQASRLIAQDARVGKIEKIHIPRFYEALVRFWKSFGLRTIDRGNETLFPIRKELARCCSTVSLFLPEGRKFFKYYPRPPKVEGPHWLKKNEVLRGALACTCGFSLYEFHWEYPIEGFGVRKDLIAVIRDDNARMPLLDWCEENDIIVFCNRCGLEITYEVSRDCPWRRWNYGVR